MDLSNIFSAQQKIITINMNEKLLLFPALAERRDGVK
jgi:hypothetical protein